MQDYIVSARKYRPMSWQTVVGQDALTTTLRNAIRTNRLAHAYLFCGPRGVGKTTCARIFARTINCLSPTPDLEACGQCESCRAFNENRSFNIHELDAASNNSVDDVRQLTEQVQIPPQVGKYKVFIIDEVHMLSQAAFNAFLKTLEEPPAHVIFILATTERHKILPTILSRCQTFDFNRITIADTVSHLQMVAQNEGFTADPEALAVIAQKADGGMRDALSIFDQVAGYAQGNITYDKVIENLGVLDHENYFRMVDLLLEKKIPDSMLLLNDVLSKGFDAGQFINGLATHLRGVMMSRDASTLPLLQCSEQVRERYRQQAARCQDRFIYRALKLCTGCEVNYRSSRNKRLLVEVTLVQISGADDDPAGRRPAKSLPKIFSWPVQEVQDNVATNDAKINNPAASVSVPRTTPSAAPVAATATIKRLGGMSIRGMQNGTNTPSRAASSLPAPAPQSSPVVEAAPVVAEQRVVPHVLDEEKLRVLWSEFANQLSQDEVALQKRMLALTPQLASPQQFTVTVANPISAQDLEQQGMRIKAFFAKSLGGTDVKMEILIDESLHEETMSRPQMFNAMAEQHPVVARLKELFSLELA